MDGFDEDIFYEDRFYSNFEDDSEVDSIAAAEREAALYSLVHHSEESFTETGLSVKNCDDFTVNARNKVSRLDIVHRKSLSHNSMPYEIHKQPHKCSEYISLKSTSPSYRKYQNNTYNGHYKQNFKTRGRRPYEFFNPVNLYNTLQYEKHHTPKVQSEKSSRHVPYANCQVPSKFSCQKALNTLYSSNSNPPEREMQTIGSISGVKESLAGTPCVQPVRNRSSTYVERSEVLEKNVVRDNNCNLKVSSLMKNGESVGKSIDERSECTDKSLSSVYSRTDASGKIQTTTPSATTINKKHFVSAKNMASRHGGSGAESDSSVVELLPPQKSAPPIIALDSSDELDCVSIPKLGAEVPLIVLDSDDEATEKKIGHLQPLLLNITPLPSQECSVVINDEKPILTDKQKKHSMSPNERFQKSTSKKQQKSPGTVSSNVASTSNLSEPPSKKKKKINKGKKKQKNGEQEKIKEKIKEKKNNGGRKNGKQTILERMEKFYGDSWGGEKFDHIAVQRKMKDDPSCWKILDVDKRSPDKNIHARGKCGNCNQWGHMKKFCPQSPRPCVCFMCGQLGHREFKCPMKICLRCGQPASIYGESCLRCCTYPLSCSSCGQHDHFASLCPTIWRRFHTVTTMEAVNSGILPNPIYKAPRDLVCCICGGKGHMFSSCTFKVIAPHRPNVYLPPQGFVMRDGRVKKRNRPTSFLDRSKYHDAKRRRTF